MVALEKLRCLTANFTVLKVFFIMPAEKTTFHTAKCTGTDRNFSSATINYLSAVFSVHLF